MALFIWMEKYVSICVIAWVIVPLPTCWKAYHFYHPVTLVTVINPWNWQDTSYQGREDWVIFEGKSHLNGEKRDGTTKSNTAPDSSVVMFQGYGFDSGLSLIIFHIPLHAVKAHELLTEQKNSASWRTKSVRVGYRLRQFTHSKKIHNNNIPSFL